jgi:hypothetical protein
MALVNRFPLTTNANDIVGSITPTNNGSVTFSTVNGASFNGTNQWLSFSKNITLGNPISISIWLRFFNVTQNACPFSSDSSGTNITGLWYLGGSEQGAYGEQLCVNSGGYILSNYLPSLFVLCTLTYDGSSILSLYRGNTLVHSNSISGQSTPDSNWAIGRRGAVSYGYFLGNALDARMYNHCQTSLEVAINNASGPNGIPQQQNKCYVGGM